MAKIDVSKIEGYADMTLEQKVAAMEGYEYDDNSSEVERYKNAASKANSEAADWKKKHLAFLSKDEQDKAAAEEEIATLRNRVSELEEKETLSSYKASFLSLGYEENLASETANALAKGEMDKLFANLKKHQDMSVKKIRSDILKDTPKPEGGTPSGNITKEQFRGMTAQERYEFSVNHPEEYNELYGGN